MPPRKSDASYLWDMLSAAREVSSFVNGKTWEEYETRVGLRRQVERSVEIVGEAARHVSKQFQEAHPEIPWPKIIGQRHRLAHEYDLIRDSAIWRVATVYVPELIRALEPLIPPLPPDPEAP